MKPKRIWKSYPAIAESKAWLALGIALLFTSLFSATAEAQRRARPGLSDPSEAQLIGGWRRVPTRQSSRIACSVTCSTMARRTSSGT